MSLLICFSGQIGSGKSSVSCAVAHALGWRGPGFGDYLRAEIERAGGDPSSRQALQDLGQQRIEADAEGFCRDVLNAGGFILGEDFIVDGVRHFDMFKSLESGSLRPCRLGCSSRSRDEAARLIRIEGSSRTARILSVQKAILLNGEFATSYLRGQTRLSTPTCPFKRLYSKCLAGHRETVALTFLRLFTYSTARIFDESASSG